MKTPGFIIKNETIWPLQISLNQVGPLYFDVIQPGQEFRRDTGAVWFTIKGAVFLDEKNRITNWDAIWPIAAITGSVLLAAVTAGAGAYAAGPAMAAAGGAASAVGGATGMSAAALAATSAAATTLVGAGFSASASLVIAGVVVGGTSAAVTSTISAALKDIFSKQNTSVSRAGCYAGPPWPFRDQVKPWRITGGPTYRQVPNKDQVELIGNPLRLVQ